MSHGLQAALAAAILLALSACAPPTPAHQTNAASLAAKAEAGVYMVGTLAPLGSFEYDAAPLYTENAIVRHRTALALKRNEITVDAAQSVLDATDHVRALLDAAVAACNQSDRTGRCAGSHAKADASLAAARAALAAIR